MGMLKLYKCDAKTCTETTVKEPKVQQPHAWIRLTVKEPDTEEATTGAFHDVKCAHDWLDQQLGMTHVDKTPTGSLAGAGEKS